MKKTPLRITPEIPERLHKVLASMGVGSRRKIEQWIKEERILVNGKIATIAQKITSQDKVQMGEKIISLKGYLTQETRVLIYNKPIGEICSHSSFDGKKTVYANLPRIREGKWISIGRLDLNTSGLLLFTNNGQLAHKLMHPRFQIERQYLVRVLGNVTDEKLNCLKKGVELDGQVCCFKEIFSKEKSGANQWFIVTLLEGKYREVRRLWESQGCQVSRLTRIRYANIDLPRRLYKGNWQEMPLEIVKEWSSSLIGDEKH